MTDVCPGWPNKKQKSERSVWNVEGLRVQRQDGIPIFAPELQNASEDYDPSFYSILANAECGHFWFENRNRIITKLVHRYFPSAEEFLEVGCGTGFVLRAIAQAFPDLIVSATEMHLEGLRMACERVPRVNAFQADARNLPFRDTFDLIGFFDVLEHIEEDQAVLDSAQRALRPGGGVLITVPQHRRLWSEVDRISGHKRRYSCHEICTKVEQAGFRIIHSTSFTTVLLPLVWLNRCLPGNNKVPMNLVRRQFEVGRFENAILSSLLAMERFVLDCGIRLPVGTSRLVVAKKKV